MSHVLIVEDHAENRNLLKLLLEVNGYRVSTAGDGLEALAAARRDAPDAIVSDALMPKMDGFALCRAWMQDERLRAIPFIFYSATYVHPDDARFAIALGAVRYLIKPLEAEKFLAELRAVLGQWAGREAPLPAAPLDDSTTHAFHESALARKLEHKIAQLEAAKLRLEESETRFRSLTEMSSDFYWESDTEHRLVQRSSAVKKLSTVSVFQRGAQIGERRWDIPHLSPDAAGWAAHRAVLDAHQPFREFELSRLGIDGTERFISISGDPVFDAAGVFTGYRGVGTDITERKRAQSALRASEVQLKGILESTAEGILAVGPDGKVVRTNRRFAEMWRIPDALLDSGDDQALLDHVVGQLNDAEAFLSKVRALYASDAADTDTLTFKDGRIFERHSSPFILDGAVLGRVWSFRDITERTRVETALRESGERLRATFEGGLDGILVVDIESHRFLAGNPEICRMLGYTLEEILRMGPADIHRKEDLRNVMEQFERLLRGETELNADIPVMRKDGSVFYTDIKGARIRFDGKDAMLGNFRDITARKQAERALIESEQRFRSLVEQAVSGIFILQDGKFAYVNPRVVEILGYDTAAQLIGREALSLVAQNDRDMVNARMGEQIRSKAPSGDWEFTAQRRDGNTVLVGVHAALATHNGRPAVIGLIQDISEKRRAEEQIQRYVAQLENAFMSTVEVATTMGEMRDPYTAGHQRRVAEIAVAVGAELGFDARRQEGLRVAGYLHDLGKIRVPSEILSKPGRLSPAEFQLVQGHAQASHDVLKGVEFPWPVAQIALQHHERMDGSGYPQGLKGEAILLEARIVAVADVIEAMSSHRPYRPGLGIDKALAEIERGRGGSYDTEVVDACLRLFRERGFSIPD